jgi:hypothetical protein
LDTLLEQVAHRQTQLELNLDTPRPREMPLTAAVKVYRPDQIWAVAPRRDVADAWEIFRCVPEVHYLITQQARVISRVEWDVSVDGRESEPEEAERFMAEAFGSTKKVIQMTRMAVIHLQVAGSYWLTRVAGVWHIYGDPLPSKRRAWLLDNAEVFVRVWHPDPLDEELADSPVLASIDVGRELILARAQSRAQARNRTAQLGIVLYPRDGVDDPDQFEADLSETITAPLADERSTSVAVPNIVGFSSEYIDAWKVLDLSNKWDEKLTDRVERLIRQLAIGMDAPAEILLGMTEANHWTSWLVQEDNWMNHCDPYAGTIGSGYSEAISELTDLDEGVLEITPDPAELLKRRPTLEDTFRANELGAVGLEYVRTQLGADDNDAPTPEEIAAKSSQQEAPANEEPTQPAIAAVQPGVPFNVDELLRIDEVCLEQLIDTVDLAVQRALTKVGSKLRSMAQRDKALELPAGSSAEVAIRVDTSNVPNLEPTVQSAVEEFAGQVRKIITRSYAKVRAAGVPLAEEPTDVDDAVTVFSVAATSVALTALNGQPTTALLWQAAVAVRSVAGGNGDPRQQATAASINLSLSGLALGGRAMGVILDVFELVADRYEWDHVGGSGHDHPEHKDLNGEIIDQEYVLRNGVNWFPGDHDGCRCQLRPVLRKVS